MRGGAGPDLLGRLGDLARQRPAAQRLHHHDPDLLLGGQRQPRGPGLVVDVHEVVLDLAELPVVGAEDAREGARRAVEREPEVGDAPVGPGALHRLEPAQVAHGLEAVVVEGVQQVEVDAVGREALELLVEVAVPVVAGLREPHRVLGRELHPGAPGPRERAPHERLALAAVVGPGGVHVVDAGLDRPVQEARRLLLVDARGVAGDDRQAHAAEAERRDLQTWDLGEGAVEHGPLEVYPPHRQRAVHLDAQPDR